jgi:hypothetical protein
VIYLSLTLLTLYATSDLIGLTTSASTRPLNEKTFVPFTITSKEQITPTAFILTVQPSAIVSPSLLSSLLPVTSHASEPVISAAWESGRTWSVEVKQPQLQVAREYTPLPPLAGEGKGELRFLIRRLEKGEVSTYLSNLGPGDEISLRGPHMGFDVAHRLGEKDHVVFLAGGTGIAPALQVVNALEIEERRGKGMPRVDIVWANRSRKDCVGCQGLMSEGVLGGEVEGPILHQLAELQRRYPGRITVRCAVDEERSFIDIHVISRAAGLPAPTSTSSTSIFGWKTKAPPPTEDEKPKTTKCWIHGQDRVMLRPATETENDHCECADGRNLLFVSGPDGFIEAYAGAKRWAGGMELQGTLAGLVGELRKNYPAFGRDWLVLKL